MLLIFVLLCNVGYSDFEILSGTAEIFSNTNIRYTSVNYCTLKQISVSTKLRCFSKCILEMKCKSFGFNVASSICRMYTVPLQPSKLIASGQQNGWVYYRKNGVYCPENYYLDEISCICIRYFPPTSNIETYEEKQSICKQEEGELVRIDSYTKKLAVQYILGLANSPSRTVIQGRMYDDDIIFDDETEMTYTDWHPDEPDGQLGEDVKYIIIRPPELQWHDTAESGIEKAGFVCERMF